MAITPFKHLRLVAILLIVFLSSSCLKATKPTLPKVFPARTAPSGKPPIILIPGILGSELVNAQGERIWPEVFPKDRDALLLPITSDVLAENRDDLVVTRVMESADLGALIPQIGVYEGLLKALEDYGGYKRGDLAHPPQDGFQDTYYLFAYDWRCDNVEAAQKLSATIERLKAQWNKPDLRFDVIGHSMGGLVARYFAMYGDRDLTSEPQADWAGARHINRLILMGSPNAGSFDAFRTIHQGYSVTAADKASFKLFRGTHRRMTFTVPSVYQLLPRNEGARFYDAKLQRLALDWYDAATWRKWQWSAAFAPDIANEETKKLGVTTQQQLAARRAEYLQVVLNRARAFHQALDAVSTPPEHLRPYLIGGDCEATIAGALLVTENNQPRTLFWPNALIGDRKQRRAALDLIFLPGDGRVIRQSLMGLSTLEPYTRTMQLAPQQTLFNCEVHGDLPLNLVIQNNLLTVLLGNRY
ncbi:MAG: hypothetical protein HOP19_23055 [Acidobacteria bacterium]|nr:hypothetical protein [Acidobacteriota bacterium]